MLFNWVLLYFWCYILNYDIYPSIQSSLQFSIFAAILNSTLWICQKEGILYTTVPTILVFCFLKKLSTARAQSNLWKDFGNNVSWIEFPFLNCNHFLRHLSPKTWTLWIKYFSISLSSFPTETKTQKILPPFPNFTGML